jgi:hypothetical protein
MLKRILLPAAVIGLALPAVAFAAPVAGVQGTVSVNGAVAARCLFTSDSATIDIPELSDITTGVLDPATVNKTAQLQGWCNGTAATIQVEAQPLLNGSSAPTGFTYRVDYTATATVHPDGGDKAVSDNSVAVNSDNAATTAGVFTGSIDVTLSSATSPTGKLIAGAYLGHVIVTLSPGA